MLCQACQQQDATVRVIEVVHPTSAAPALQPGVEPANKPVAKPTGGPAQASGASESSDPFPSLEAAGQKPASHKPDDLDALYAELKAADQKPASDNLANATTSEQWLCETCAQSHHGVHGQANLAEVWKLLQAQRPGARKPAPGAACPDCGMTLRDFRQRGRLGCPKDYEIFGAQLRDLLERIHGASRHVGRSPNSDEAAILRRKRLDELQQELASAIRDEAYEQAAKLRDEIKSLERA
jgi:protein arginine kinase activator